MKIIKILLLATGFIVLVYFGISGMIKSCPPEGCDASDQTYNPAYKAN